MQFLPELSQSFDDAINKTTWWGGGLVSDGSSGGVPLVNIVSAPAPSPTSTQVNGGGCMGCSHPTTTPTPFPTPSPMPPAVPSPVASPSSSLQTYSSLVAPTNGSAAVTTTGASAMQGDWWKYLVGAAIGYFLAKR